MELELYSFLNLNIDKNLSHVDKHTVFNRLSTNGTQKIKKGNSHYLIPSSLMNVSPAWQERLHVKQKYVLKTNISIII